MGNARIDPASFSVGLPLDIIRCGASKPAHLKQSLEMERMERWLGSALARHTGQMEGEAIGHIWAFLGILFQRGNAALLGNRVPELPLPAIDGIE